jgi:hypothetical protein
MLEVDLKLSPSKNQQRKAKVLRKVGIATYRLSPTLGLEIEEDGPWPDDDATRKLKVSSVRIVVHSTASCYFFTNSTGYIGLLVSKHGAQTGDQVVLLRGAPMPMILRRRNGHFQLIGRCYVQDLMRGEYWVSKIHAGAQLEKFILV